MPGGLDHCYALPGPAGAVRPVALLEAPAARRWLLLATDQPGLQVYTGGLLRAPFAPHAAVALEAQLLPDTPNHPELGSAELRPGRRYRSVTRLRFGTGPAPGL